MPTAESHKDSKEFNNTINNNHQNHQNFSETLEKVATSLQEGSLKNASLYVNYLVRNFNETDFQKRCGLYTKRSFEEMNETMERGGLVNAPDKDRNSLIQIVSIISELTNRIEDSKLKKAFQTTQISVCDYISAQPAKKNDSTCQCNSCDCG